MCFNICCMYKYVIGSNGLCLKKSNLDGGNCMLQVMIAIKIMTKSKMC